MADGEGGLNREEQGATGKGWRGAAWLLAGLLGLAGCAPLQPPAQPAQVLAPAYPGEGSPEAATLPDWRGYFLSPDLQALIAQALENNRNLRVAVLRVEQARAAYGIQRAAQFPLLAAQASETRSRTPADLNLTRRPLVAGDYQVGLGLASWELDLWGRVSQLKQAALETYLAGDEQRRAVTLALIAEVAQAYFQLRELDERVALAERTVASRAESLRIFTRREALGATSRLALTQVETLLTQAQALLVQARQQREAQWQALTLIIGAPPVWHPTPAALDEATELVGLRPGLPSQLLERRPDLRAAEHQLRAARARVEAARAAFFPQISLTAALGTASAELGGLFDRGSRAWQVAPALTLPLFDAGLREQNLSLAALREHEAVAQYELTVQQAFRDVADALDARQALGAQLEIARHALAVQRERSRLAQLRYDHGAAPYLEVLDAERDLLSTEQQLLQTRRALLASRVALYAALGGGADPSTTPLPPPN